MSALVSQVSSAASFDPTRIIDDAVFYNSSSMTPEQIQTFLNSKTPTCDNWGTKPHGGTTRAAYAQSRGQQLPFTCLKDYYENPTTHANNLYGAAVPSGSMSAAQIIHQAAQGYGINPQVLLVTLQKEQGFITDDWPWASQYNTAMGFGCPDSGPNNSANCNATYYGFYNQVHLAARQFRLYANNPNDYNYVPGPGNYVQFNPNAGCGGTTLNIFNQATASLYNYTPYQPNAAALAAGYGTGDGCSAYGNRNFFNYFNDWFGSTYNQVTYVQMQGQSAQYIIYEGKKQALTYDGLLAWGINKLPLVTMSAASLNAIPSMESTLTRYATVRGTSSKVFADNANYYDINDGTVAVWGGFKNTAMSYVGWPVIRATGFGGNLPIVINKVNDPNQYFMEAGTLLPISSPSVLRAWGGGTSITISDTYAQGLATGQTIYHNIVTSNGQAYYLSNNKMFRMSSKLLNLFAGWQPYPIGTASLGRFSNSGDMSHLVKSSSGSLIYALDKGTKRPISSFDVFISLRNSSAYESQISDDASSIIPVGASFSSAFLKLENASTYSYVDGVSSPVPDRLVQEYGLSSKAMSVSSSFINLFSSSGAQVSQFAKSKDSSVVYFISEGKRIPITRYDVMVLLGGQNSLTTLNNSDINSLTNTTSPMTPLIKTVASNQAALVDQKSLFTSADQAMLRRWNAPEAVTVSQATFDWFTVSSALNAPLSSNAQVEDGHFCHIDTLRYCAEQHNMIFVWNLITNTVRPSDTLLTYLNMRVGGRLSTFVTSFSGQPYSSNVFHMVDGKLYYITTPDALSNLGFDGYMTRLSSTTIDVLRDPAPMNGYLFKDTSNTLWVFDSNVRRKVNQSIESNWSSQSVAPMSVSTYYIGLYAQGSDMTKSITGRSPGAIYGMDSGLKRGITTYEKYLQSWAPYTHVSNPLLNIIPNGQVY